MESHLLQMRGLKRKWKMGRRKRQTVASFTDAWIETFIEKNIEATKEVASFTDAWIETMTYAVNGDIGTSHLLQMRGLKLREIVNKIGKKVSHLLQMRGLKPLII